MLVWGYFPPFAPELINVLFICNEIKPPQQAEEICISNRQQQQKQQTIACSSNLQLREISEGG